MADGLALLGSLVGACSSVLNQGGESSRQHADLLARLLEVLGAAGGGLCSWPSEGRPALCATRGFSSREAASLRRLARQVPPRQGLPRQCQEVAPGQEPATAWPELNEVLGGLAAERSLALWPLAWAGGGRGLACLRLPAGRRWSEAFSRVAAGHLGLALGNVLLQRQAESHSDDYQRIFQNSQDMVYLSSREGRWVRVNPAGVRMLGYQSEGELLEVPDSAQAAYLDPRDREGFMSAIEREGFVKDYEVTFKRQDGTPVEVSITSQVRLEDGQVVGYEGIIKDITHRKLAEAQAERERWVIESILEAMPVAVFVVDHNHEVIHWNRACTELTGVPREDILGTRDVWKVFQRPPGVSLADLVVDGDEKRLFEYYGQQRLRRSPLAEDAWEAELHLDDLGGRPKDLFFVSAGLCDPQGKVLGAVEAVLDFTSLKDLEGQLAESEALYRTMVEANQEGIALHDGRRFIFANQPFFKMFGLAGLEQAAGDLLEFMAPACQRSYLEWRRELSEAVGVSRLFEGQGLRGDSTFDLEMNAAGTIYQGQRAMLFTVRDVTYRKRMEEQLIRSERLAATGKLAFDIAHEVNNPLGGILTYAHLLAEDLGDENPLQATAEKIIKLTNRCKIIVRGLLDFARQDTPSKEAVDLNQMLVEMLSLIEGHVILQGIEVVKKLQTPLPSFYGHRSKLEQVFLNMVVNAAEAMEGRGRLELYTRHDPRAGEILVAFKDNGPGIPEEVARRVFEPFFTTKARGRGTGLGLAISHGIIKQHNGRIELETAPGQGATFTVVLPCNSHLDSLALGPAGQ